LRGGGAFQESLYVTNDAKLGLVLGVGLVITLAVLFFHKDAGGADPSEATVNAAGAANARPKPPAKAPGGGQHSVKAKPTSGSSEKDALSDPASDAADDGHSATTSSANPTPAAPNALQQVGGLADKELLPAPQ
jgi:hypothetical protein